MSVYLVTIRNEYGVRTVTCFTYASATELAARHANATIRKVAA